MKKRFFTSESVTEGHPDKVCDQIADAILDDIFAEDTSARVAVEVCATTGMVMVFGEVTTKHYCDIPSIVRGVIKDVGYNDSSLGFDYKTCAVLSSIDEQSPDIAMGVNDATDGDGKDDYERTGAGDQGMMFGYACDETESLMPLPITLAHALTKRLTDVRKSGELEWLRPDGKAQVTVEYIDDVPERVDTIVVSCQHSENISMESSKRKSSTRSSLTQFRKSTSTTIRRSTSTRRADLSSAVPQATAALREERLSSTPTADSAPTAAARSAEKTPRKWTEAQAIWLVISAKISLRQACARERNCKLHTQSAWRIPFRCTSTRSARAL